MHCLKREIVESLRVPVPLDPAKILHDSLCRFGQTFGVHYHLVNTKTFEFSHNELLMQVSGRRRAVYFEKEVETIYSLHCFAY